MATMMRMILMLMVVASSLPLQAAQRDAMVEISTLSPRERELLSDIQDMERKLVILRDMQPEQRYQQGERLGRDLERLLQRVTGTRYENHALYWLADWVMTYQQDLDRVSNLLSRLGGSRNPAHQGAGRALMVRVLLGQGQIPQAEQLATALVTEIPEFAPVLRLVEFHQRVGQAAPQIPGRNLTGGPADPLTARHEPWLLYVFLALGDSQQRFGVDRILSELGREEYQGRIRLVVVTFDGDPLLAMDRLREIPRGQEADLLWANPNEDGDAAQWQSAWNLPATPVTALIGPDRSIMAVNPPPRRLRPLGGLDAGDSVESQQPQQGLWRGRREMSNRR
jgi:hypothetical protein